MQQSLPMIVVEDEGKPPIAWKRYDWARGKRRLFESAYDVGRAIWENVYPREEYHCRVGKDKWEVFGRWGKAWWGMRQMRKDWGELSYPDKMFLTWGLVRVTSVEDLRCCAQPHVCVHGDYPYTCNHDTIMRSPSNMAVACTTPTAVVVFTSRLFVFCDVARTDEIKKREGDVASKETAPPPAKKTRMQEAKKGARAPIAFLLFFDSIYISEKQSNGRPALFRGRYVSERHGIATLFNG